MREIVVEPAERVAILLGVLRHRKRVCPLGFEHDLRRRQLDRIDDAPRRGSGQEQIGDLLDIGRFVFADQASTSSAVAAWPSGPVLRNNARSRSVVPE